MKKTRSKRIAYDSLQDVIDFANLVIKDNPGMTYSDFDIDQEYKYGDSSIPVLEYRTEETPQERILREKIENEQKTRWEERDRQKFEELKKKFEGKSN